MELLGLILGILLLPVGLSALRRRLFGTSTSLTRVLMLPLLVVKFCLVLLRIRHIILIRNLWESEIEVREGEVEVWHGKVHIGIYHREFRRGFNHLSSRRLLNDCEEVFRICCIFLE